MGVRKMSKILRVILANCVLLATGCATPQYTYRPYELRDNPEMTFEQAIRACEPRAHLEGLEAKNAALSESNARRAQSTSYNCNTQQQGYGWGNNYKSTCTPNGQGLGGAVSGLGDTIAAGGVYNTVFNSSMGACMAREGWSVEEICVANCD
jgi:hypothetical protein